MMIKFSFKKSLFLLFLIILGFLLAKGTRDTDRLVVLKPSDFKHYVETFNSTNVEDIVNMIPDDESWKWMTENIPFFECPDKAFEKIFYFRWWTYRKHIRETEDGIVITEFLPKVKHSGIHNTISCALGHHIMEGRWLKDQSILDDYIKFWFRSNNGKPPAHFHKFSQWTAWAIWQRSLVHPDSTFISDLLPDLIQDYTIWENERQFSNGLFWQYDVRDGMEESISGSRTMKNMRPTINSYMAGNAWAISQMTGMFNEKEISITFQGKAAYLKNLLLRNLWDYNAEFFKARLENGTFSSAREAIGFIPWYFNIPETEHAVAWQQITDTTGFKAPWGLTTAERRHPLFRTHGTGTCEWDGAIWPFATSQTLTGMANLLRNQDQEYITKSDYFDALLAYARSNQKNGQPFIGEYQDEKTGQWLRDEPRSSYYNHSTFCDLVISGLIGVIPKSENIIEIDPLLPEKIWNWFALDGLIYHGNTFTILWDASGEKYRRGQGLTILMDGKQISSTSRLEKLLVEF